MMTSSNHDFESQEYTPIDPDISPDLSPSLAKRIAMWIVIALLLCGGVVALLFLTGILSPAKLTVAAAFSSTATQLKEEGDALIEELPALDYLDELGQRQSTLTLSSTLPKFDGTLYLTMDKMASQYILKGSTSDETRLAATAYLSPDDLIIHLEDSDNAIGLNLRTLAEDLADSPYGLLRGLDTIMEGYQPDFVKNMDQMDEELLRILKDSMVPLSTDWSAKKSDDESLEINGTLVQTAVYTLDFDHAVIRTAAQNTADEFCASPVFSPYLSFIARWNDITLDELHDKITERINKLLDDTIQLDECTFTVNIYDGRVVMITANNDGESPALVLSPTDEVLSYVALVTRDAHGISPYLSTSITAEQGAYTAHFNLLDMDYALRYFNRDTSDNLILSKGEETLLVSTVDTSVPDALTFVAPLSTGCISLESALTTLEPDWFAPPEYTNLLSMSPTDLLLLAMAVAF